MFKHINQINEQAFLINFGEIINKETNNMVIKFANIIINDKKNINKLNILNCVPSYNKILVQFNPLQNNKKDILNYLKNITISKVNIKSRIIEIPICYENKFSLDMENISNLINLTKEEIIELHLKTTFHIYMIGFMPGLPFMGNLEKNLNVSRKSTPNLNVPKGSVGIVDDLCVIYPQDSPGGWNIIGRTPVELFYKNKLRNLKPGNKVRFKRISTREYDNFDK